MELDPTEELWDLGRNKTITAEVRKRTRSPFMCSDLGNRGCIVSCTETTTKSSSASHFYFVPEEHARFVNRLHMHTMGAATFY